MIAGIRGGIVTCDGGTANARGAIVSRDGRSAKRRRHVVNRGGSVAASLWLRRLRSYAYPTTQNSRHALIEVAAAMFGVRSPDVPVATLTPAERDVLELLRRGLTNAEISRLRGRSKNTVANQMAAILQKSGAPSRRALATTRLP